MIDLKLCAFYQARTIASPKKLCMPPKFQMKSQPKRAKGRRYPVEICCVAWMDLLGYGSMLRPVSFNPSAPSAQQAVQRLEAFQAVVARHANRYMRALIVNDGVAYVRQLSPRTVSVTYDFLRRAFEAFKEVNDLDRGQGFPGARMILASGPRLRIKDSVSSADDHRDAILAKFQRGEISAEKAICAAARVLPYTGSLIELQANFAFTKAYLADESGSRAGLEGANFYVDTTIFDDRPPSWLDVESEIDWAVEGLSARFAKVANIDSETAGEMKHAGMRDALEIAKALGVTY